MTKLTEFSEIAEENYVKACSNEKVLSAIHEHLPTLRKLAEKIDHVTEFGVAEGWGST